MPLSMANLPVNKYLLHFFLSLISKRKQERELNDKKKLKSI